MTRLMLGISLAGVAAAVVLLWHAACSGVSPPDALQPLGTWEVPEFGTWSGPWHFFITEENLIITGPTGRRSESSLTIEREAPHLVRLRCEPPIPPFGGIIDMGSVAGGGVALTANGYSGEARRSAAKLWRH